MNKKDKIISVARHIPWFTAVLVAKHIDGKWSENNENALNRAWSILNFLLRKGEIEKLKNTDKLVFTLKNNRQRTGDFDHNHAVISVLMNAFFNGHSIWYGGRKKSDGIINEKIAIEVDRGNHSIEDLKNQILKYTDDIDKILYISFPKHAVMESESNTQLQIGERDDLIRKVKRIKLTRKIRKKLFFATYLDATNPDCDPLREKVWHKLDDRVVSVIIR